MQKYILFSILFFPFILKGQQELGLHFMRPTYQSNYTNPAFFMPQKIAICMPSVYTNYGNSAFSQKNVISQDSVIDLTEADDKIKDYNYLSAGINISPFAAGLRINNLQFGLTTGARFFTYLGYNKNTFTLFTQGNKGFIGQKVNVAPDFQLNMFTEIGLSAAYRFLNDRLSVGVRGKYLLGVADISTSRKNREISLYTNPDVYQLEMTTDYQVNTSLIGLNLDSVLSGSQNFRPQISSKNRGVAFDIGAEFQVSKKLSVAASIIDLGSIGWNESVTNFRTKGNYTYEGVDAAALVLRDSAIEFSAIADSLAKALKFEKTAGSSYKTPLNTQFYLSASYRVLPIIRVGGLLYGQFVYGKMQPSVAISGNFELKKWFSVGVVAAYRNKHLMPPGLNVSLGSGPVQAFFATDNIVGVFMPFQTRDYNTRVGFNWLFGYKN